MYKVSCTPPRTEVTPITYCATYIYIYIAQQVIGAMSRTYGMH